MFHIAPSKHDQSTLRYWLRNQYKARINGVSFRNTSYCGWREHTDVEPCFRRSQIRLRPILMTQEQKDAVLRATGSVPYLDRTFIPVRRGRARSLTRKKA